MQKVSLPHKRGAKVTKTDQTPHQQEAKLLPRHSSFKLCSKTWRYMNVSCNLEDCGTCINVTLCGPANNSRPPSRWCQRHLCTVGTQRMGWYHVHFMEANNNCRHLLVFCIIRLNHFALLVFGTTLVCSSFKV